MGKRLITSDFLVKEYDTCTVCVTKRTSKDTIKWVLDWVIVLPQQDDVQSTSLNLLADPILFVNYVQSVIMTTPKTTTTTNVPSRVKGSRLRSK